MGGPGGVAAGSFRVGLPADCYLHANNRASRFEYGRNALFALAERARHEFGGVIDSAIGTGEAVSDRSAVHRWVYRPGQLCLLHHKFVVHVRFSRLSWFSTGLCCFLVNHMGTSRLIPANQDFELVVA